MDRFSSEDRQRIVKVELEQLRKMEYISADTYNEILDAQHKYYTSLAKKKALDKAKQNQSKKLLEKQNKSISAKLEPEKVKKTLSPQEVRERNITWALNLGVILLLIGGLVLATSTWDSMNNWMKTGLIGLVSVFFFGLAYISGRVLRIEKTAFAFHVLGSLFLPIVILSVAYFELLGTYLSFTGEGRYIYGAIGSIVILPIYLLLSIRLHSRLFVWFSYVTVSALASFLIAALYLSVDGFYLGIMLFNGSLILAYRYFRNNRRYHLFIKEFTAFIQANLILSTLLMLVFYNDEVVHSFTLLLTAILYFSMIFITKQKEYHFVFTVMLIYGAYQLIEFSILNEISEIAYALLGMIFLGLPVLIKDNTYLQKAFKYTSAIVSACAFIYISLEGVLLRFNEPSIILFIAYIIISFNFLSLSQMVKQRLFRYLSPAFLVAAFYQAARLGQEILSYESLIFPMFLAGIFLYIVLGCYMKLNFFKNIKDSSRDIGLAVMGVSIFAGFISLSWLMIGTMFILLSITMIFMKTFEERKSFKQYNIASWTHGITLGLAVVFYYGELIGNKYFVVAGLIVLIVSFIWKKLKQPAFSHHSFFVANAFYAYGILQTFSPNYNEWIQVFIVLGGIGMAYLLYLYTKWSAMPYVVSSISLLFYLTILNLIDTQFHVEADLYHSLQFVTGAILLLGVGLILERKDRILMKGFWWVGHLYLPIALLHSYLLYEEVTMGAFALATVIYGLSVFKATTPTLKKAFLYACFTTVWIFISTAMILFDFQEYVHYSFLGTSAVIALLWIIWKGNWRRIIAYYLVPLSILGMIVFQSVVPYRLDIFITTLLFAVGLLIIMHKEKWDIFNVMPLLIIFYAIGLYRYGLFEVMVFAILLTVIGTFSYQTIYRQKNNKIVTIDWYTVISFLAMFNLYNLTNESLWTKVLPGLLITINLFLQRKRITYISPKWITFIAGSFLLQPYYTLLREISIPTLVERELYVLPWIVLAIFLKKVTDRQHQGIANYIQWAVLIIVSLLLIQDGLASSTIYDALILGTLALASIIAGMAYQLKSFFFVGVGVLLLNVLLQTRPYWGNLPWWAYLLIAGSILIFVASYNEWHKQKVADHKETMLLKFKEKVIDRIKKWD